LNPSNPDLSSQALVAAAVKGDGNAISSLLKTYGPGIERQLKIDRRWRHAFDAGDVMQVTYMEVFLQMAHFRPEKADSFESWLRRIAENNLRDAIRGLGRQKQPPPSKRISELATNEGSFVDLFETLTAHSSTPSRSLARKDIRRLIDAAIERLPEDYSHVIRTHDLDGRSINEVAEGMNRSAGAVHMLLSRARERLGELLETASVWFDART
jgi:RNA polymerase sigma-70 factor (ECF subfamily)